MATTNSPNNDTKSSPSRVSSSVLSSTTANNTTSGARFKDKRPEPLKLNNTNNQEIPLDLSVKSAGFLTSTTGLGLVQSNTLETPRIIWQDNEYSLNKTSRSFNQKLRLSSMGDSPPITPMTPYLGMLSLLSSPSQTNITECNNNNTDNNNNNINNNSRNNSQSDSKDKWLKSSYLLDNNNNNNNNVFGRLSTSNDSENNIIDQHNQPFRSISSGDLFGSMGESSRFSHCCDARYRNQMVNQKQRNTTYNNNGISSGRSKYDSSNHNNNSNNGDKRQQYQTRFQFRLSSQESLNAGGGNSNFLKIMNHQYLSKSSETSPRHLTDTSLTAANNVAAPRSLLALVSPSNLHKRHQLPLHHSSQQKNNNNNNNNDNNKSILLHSASMTNPASSDASPILSQSNNQLYHHHQHQQRDGIIALSSPLQTLPKYSLGSSLNSLDAAIDVASSANNNPTDISPQFRFSDLHNSMQKTSSLAGAKATPKTTLLSSSSSSAFTNADCSLDTPKIKIKSHNDSISSGLSIAMAAASTTNSNLNTLNTPTFVSPRGSKTMSMSFLPVSPLTPLSPVFDLPSLAPMPNLSMASVASESSSKLTTLNSGSNQYDNHQQQQLRDRLMSAGESGQFNSFFNENNNNVDNIMDSKSSISSNCIDKEKLGLYERLITSSEVLQQQSQHNKFDPKSSESTGISDNCFKLNSSREPDGRLGLIDKIQDIKTDCEKKHIELVESITDTLGNTTHDKRQSTESEMKILTKLDSKNNNLEYIHCSNDDIDARYNVNKEDEGDDEEIDIMHFMSTEHSDNDVLAIRKHANTPHTDASSTASTYLTTVTQLAPSATSNLTTTSFSPISDNRATPQSSNTNCDSPFLSSSHYNLPNGTHNTDLNNFNSHPNIHNNNNTIITDNSSALSNVNIHRDSVSNSCGRLDQLVSQHHASTASNQLASDNFINNHYMNNQASQFDNFHQTDCRYRQPGANSSNHIHYDQITERPSTALPQLIITRDTHQQLSSSIDYNQPHKPHYDQTQMSNRMSQSSGFVRTSHSCQDFKRSLSSQNCIIKNHHENSSRINDQSNITTNNVPYSSIYSSSSNSYRTESIGLAEKHQFSAKTKPFASIDNTSSLYTSQGSKHQAIAISQTMNRKNNDEDNELIIISRQQQNQHQSSIDNQKQSFDHLIGHKQQHQYGNSTLCQSSNPADNNMTLTDPTSNTVYTRQESLTKNQIVSDNDNCNAELWQQNHHLVINSDCNDDKEHQQYGNIYDENSQMVSCCVDQQANNNQQQSNRKVIGIIKELTGKRCSRNTISKRALSPASLSTCLRGYHNERTFNRSAPPTIQANKLLNQLELTEDHMNIRPSSSISTCTYCSPQPSSTINLREAQKEHQHIYKEKNLGVKSNTDHDLMMMTTPTCNDNNSIDNKTMIDFSNSSMSQTMIENDNDLEIVQQNNILISRGDNINRAPVTKGEFSYIDNKIYDNSPFITNPSSIKQDNDVVHNQAGKKYYCSQCSKSFTRSDMLTRHRRLHSGDRPFQCLECKQEFSRSDHLATHMRTHTGEKPYKCKLCIYTACRKDMITRHMKVHQKINYHNQSQHFQYKNGTSRSHHINKLITPRSNATGVEKKQKQSYHRKKHHALSKVLAIDINKSTSGLTLNNLSAMNTILSHDNNNNNNNNNTSQIVYGSFEVAKHPIDNNDSTNRRDNMVKLDTCNLGDLANSTRNRHDVTSSNQVLLSSSGRHQIRSVDNNCPSTVNTKSNVADFQNTQDSNHSQLKDRQQHPPQQYPTIGDCNLYEHQQLSRLADTCNMTTSYSITQQYENAFTQMQQRTSLSSYRPWRESCLQETHEPIVKKQND